MYVVQPAETKFDQLSAEKEKLDSEVKRLNRAVSMLHTGPFLLGLELCLKVQCFAVRHNSHAVMLQLDAAKAAQAGHDFDINYRNTRIDEVRFLGFRPVGRSKWICWQRHFPAYCGQLCGGTAG